MEEYYFLLETNLWKKYFIILLPNQGAFEIFFLTQ